MTDTEAQQDVEIATDLEDATEPRSKTRKANDLEERPSLRARLPATTSRNSSTFWTLMVISTLTSRVIVRW